MWTRCCAAGESIPNNDPTSHDEDDSTMVGVDGAHQTQYSQYSFGKEAVSNRPSTHTLSDTAEFCVTLQNSGAGEKLGVRTEVNDPTVADADVNAAAPGEDNAHALSERPGTDAQCNSQPQRTQPHHSLLCSRCGTHIADGEQVKLSTTMIPTLPTQTSIVWIQVRMMRMLCPTAQAQTHSVTANHPTHNHITHCHPAH